jgi:hypothetical protein
MRSAILIGLVALAVGLGEGCASTSGSSDGGGTGGAGAEGGHGGSGTGGSGGAGGGNCTPACGTGSACVGTGTVGGAIITPNDAGVCPTGSHLAGGTASFCEADLNYGCQPIPAGCNGTLTCACAGTLCPSGPYSCQVQSSGELTCVEAVP